MKNRQFSTKLRNALAGIRFAWAAERNFRIEVVLGLVTVGVFAVVRPSALWWALITLCTVLVLVVELANSAMEALADHLHPEIHPVIGKVKDMLAGMVLVMCFGAAVVALIALYATLAT